MAPKKKPVFNPFASQAADDETDTQTSKDTSIHIVDEALYGPTQRPAPGLQTANAIPLERITPDPAQPRRAIPDEIRQAARTGESEWRTWHRVAEQLHGKPIDVVALLKGEGDGPEDDPIGIPLVAGFLKLVGLAASIYRDGQTNAITVVKIPGANEAYEIETGERRWQAMRMLREALEDPAFSSIKAREVPKANVWRQATENNAREPLTAIGMARQVALLIMDIYRGKDGIDLYPYRKMVQPGDCDRKFYAQVSNGNVYRVPKGMSERILQATNLKSRAQLAHYRALLDIPDEVWKRADQEDWTEGRIREYVKPPTASQDTFTTVNVSTDSVNPIPESTRQNVDSRPSPFGLRSSPLPSTDGPGTKATGPILLYQGARVEQVRIEETGRGPEAIVWTLDSHDMRRHQRRVPPGELRDLRLPWHNSAAVGLRHGLKIEHAMRQGYTWPTSHNANQWSVKGSNILFRPALNSIGAADWIDPGLLIQALDRPFEVFDRSNGAALKALIDGLKDSLSSRLSAHDLKIGWRGGGGLHNRVVWAVGGAYMKIGEQILTSDRDRFVIATPNGKILNLMASEVFPHLAPAQADPTHMDEATKNAVLENMMGGPLDDEDDFDEADDEFEDEDSDQETQVPDAALPQLDWYPLPEWAGVGKTVRDPEENIVGEVASHQWSTTHGWIVQVRFAQHNSEFPINALIPFVESTPEPAQPPRQRHPALAQPQHMIMNDQEKIQAMISAAEVLMRLTPEGDTKKKRQEVLTKIGRIRVLCADHILIKMNREGKEATVAGLQDLYETASGVLTELSEMLFRLFQEALLVADDIEADLQQKGRR